MSDILNSANLHSVDFFFDCECLVQFLANTLDRDSSYFCASSTPYGRYRSLRMLFGISTATKILQKAVHKIHEGLERLAVVVDDSLVWGATSEQQDKNLERLQERFWDMNLNLKGNKFCVF